MIHPLRTHIEQIVSLTDVEFETILSHFTLKKLRKHQYLMQAGDRATNEYFVLKGCLKSFYTDETGKDHILQFASENWWVSDYRAFYKNKNASLNIDAFEPCELLALSISNREKLCKDFQKMEHFFRIKLTNAVASLHGRVESLLAMNAQQRYNMFLQSYPHLVQRIPKQYIAAFLGVSRETLSRLSS